MKQRVVACIAMLMLSVSSSAFAGQWYLVSIGRDTILFADKSQYRKSGSTRSGWFQIVNKPQASGADSSKMKVLVDCQARKYRIEYIAVYRDDVILASRDPKKGFEEVVPDTNGSSMYKTLCEEWFNGEPVDYINVERAKELLERISSEPMPPSQNKLPSNYL